MVGEKASSTGGAGAKKKRKVKGQSQTDAPSTDRNSPDDVRPSLLGGEGVVLFTVFQPFVRQPVNCPSGLSIDVLVFMLIFTHCCSALSLRQTGLIEG